MAFDFSSLIGPGIDLVSSLFGSGRGNDTAKGFQDYMRTMQQYGDRANSMLDPWQRNAVGEMRGYNENYKKLMDPNFIKQIQGEWSMSPFAQMQMDKGKQAINNAASASGMLGGTDFGKDQADYARQITSADQQQHLLNRLGAYQTGLGHQGNFIGQGLGAAGQMSNNYMNLGNLMGQGMQGQRYGEGMQRDDTLRNVGNIGRSIFDYIGDKPGANSEISRRRYG